MTVSINNIRTVLFSVAASLASAMIFVSAAVSPLPIA